MEEVIRYDFDEAVRNEYGIFCGTDEAGRGPLAGDVYAAAVILNPDDVIEEINDSKKLSEKKREKLFDIIKEKAVSWCIATASVEEIEEINILNAAMLAMKRAVSGLDVKPEFVLVDGNKIPDGLEIKADCLVKGDALSASIGAASILAKVARDRYMKEIALKYPEYGFEKHKGYGTKQHREALLKYGPCPVHRMSFLKKILG
ncbi:MAG: ribonuclease HII [Oscillospiraceae bacterium]|nr:ribonuclease HII [Oscillospiraceae bacterium]MDY3257706.1 ribonuclease HII [Ruminococcus callidus]